jgi:ABC-type polar amino acid transport system ATPase subunit/tRNA A-37 threonylcarbamoyl transferase component Bud32
MLYEAYSYADRLFYDSPVRWGAVEEFAAAGRALPPGWVREAKDVWVGLAPQDAPLPEQGWKVHVSARLENAEEILAVVHAYCLEQRMAFKYLRSPALVHTQNAKYASRGSSGKFLTLYPVGDDALERCLGDLGSALDGQEGPYILSDLRWGEGPLYLRYGGFVEQYCRSETGELVLAMREPSGRLRPDVRRAVFEVPDWAPVPEVLRDALAKRDAAGVADFPFAVERALHFSNGGGIYLAAPADGGPQVVLKEARPHAGLDQRGTDAVTRLGHERDILRRLRGVDAVPAELGYLTAWEHHFLVQEYIEGEPLNVWFGRRFPLIHPDADERTRADYREEALGILASVREGLDAIHARGVVFGDLHPRNLILRPDGRVAFVDFELASPVDAFVRPALGAAGFAAPATVDGFAVDEYALAALTLWCFIPLLALTALDPAKIGELAEAARLRFDLSPELISTARDLLAASAPAAHEAVTRARPRHTSEQPRLLDGAALDQVRPEALREAIAYAFADPALPGDTIEAAIALAPHPVPTHRVREAARAAQADAFIRRLPRGYLTPLAEAPLSGGERQRLGLARALAHGGRLVVLDDATSSLDTITEAVVARAFDQALSGRTRLVVTHRAAIAARADEVAWLDQGRIRARGPHAELWQDPEYRAVFRRSED